MYITVEALLVATLVWVCTQISFIFNPVGTFISTLFVPVIISGFLYYLFRPVVSFLMKIHLGRFRINRTLAVSLVFLMLLGIITLALTFMIPLLISQVGQLVVKTPDYISAVQKVTNHFYNDLSDHQWMRQLDVQSYISKLEKNVMGSVEVFLGSLTKSLGTVIGMITSITVTIITVPFMLFYMLKDGHRLIPNIQKMMPSKRAEQVEELLTKMGDTISKYIAGK